MNRVSLFASQKLLVGRWPPLPPQIFTTDPKLHENELWALVLVALYMSIQ